MSDVARTNVLLPGVYAWVTTAAVPAFRANHSDAARLVALASVASLLLGVGFVASRPVLGRVLGIYAFAFLSLVVWVLLREDLAPGRLESTRAALGAASWALFAVGWGSVRRPSDVPEKDPHAIPSEPLLPHSKPPRFADLVFACSVMAAFVPLALAWQVLRPSHALFAQVVAFASAIFTITAAGYITISLGKWQPTASPSRRLGRALAPLALLAALLVVGIIAGLW